MHDFSSLPELLSFFYNNYFHFLRFDDHTVDYNGTTYKMDFAEDAPVPILKLTYFTDDGEERILLCIVDFGLLVNSERSEDDRPSIHEYVDIMSEGLFDLSIFDVAKFNDIFLRAIKDYKFKR